MAPSRVTASVIVVLLAGAAGVAALAILVGGTRGEPEAGEGTAPDRRAARSTPQIGDHDLIAAIGSSMYGSAVGAASLGDGAAGRRAARPTTARELPRPTPGLRSSARRELDPADGRAELVTLIASGGLAVHGYCRGPSASAGAFGQIRASGPGIRYYGLGGGTGASAIRAGSLGSGFSALAEAGRPGGPDVGRISATLVAGGSAVLYLDATVTIDERGRECSFALEGVGL